MKTGYKHIDLITTYHADGEPYRPELTRDTSEAARRRSFPRGNLINEEQQSGLEVTRAIMDYDFGNVRDRDFAYGRISEQLANTAFHLFGETEDVMRRRHFLPVLAEDSSDFRETRPGLLHKVRSGLAYAADSARSLTLVHQQGRETAKHKAKLGRHIGNLAIAIECLQLTDAPHGMSEFDIQKVVRFYGVDMMARARTRYKDLGVHPSSAQQARPTTPVSLEWSKYAPETNEAYEVMQQAQRDFGLTA
jgi:hypothetical protein